MEKYAVEQPECLDSDFTFFLEGALQQKNDSKRRPFAKLLYHYCKNLTRRKLLSRQQIDWIVEICFGYMLESQKASPLAFALKHFTFLEITNLGYQRKYKLLLKKNAPTAEQDLGL